MKNLTVRKLTENETPPFDLLHLADPSEQAVNDYLRRGSCYIGLDNDEIIGVFVLLPTRPFTIELVNLAVAEKHHSKGYGKRLIQHAIETARNEGYQTIEVGTGNAGIGQLALYQKGGFTITGIDFDFFTKHYPEPIFENGIECKHMIRMSMDL